MYPYRLYATVRGFLRAGIESQEKILSLLGLNPHILVAPSAHRSKGEVLNEDKNVIYKGHSFTFHSSA